MNLMEHLKFQAQESLMTYLDYFEGEPDHDQLYDEWKQEFVNSDKWWDCDDCDYNLEVFTELLETNYDFQGEYGSEDLPVTSVTRLMINYGYYHIHQGVADDAWKEAWDYKFPRQA